MYEERLKYTEKKVRQLERFCQYFSLHFQFNISFYKFNKVIILNRLSFLTTTGESYEIIVRVCVFVCLCLCVFV